MECGEMDVAETWGLTLTSIHNHDHDLDVASTVPYTTSTTATNNTTMSLIKCAKYPKPHLSLLSTPLITNSKYLALSPKTRIIAGIAIMSYAGFGILLSNRAEEKFGLVPTEEDKQKLRQAIPRIRTVERDEVP